MTHQEIIAIARGEGLSFMPEANSPLARIVRKAVAKEREACALVCEGFKQGNSATYIDDDWADMCAEAIRARGTKEGV
jgi:hypothetical protein